MEEDAKEKKSGLQKKISSIFKGVPDIEDKAEEAVPPAPDAPPPVPAEDTHAAAAGNAAAEFLQAMRAAGKAITHQELLVAPDLEEGSPASCIGLDLGEHQVKLLRLGKNNAVEAIAYHEGTEAAEDKTEILRDMVGHVQGAGAKTVLGVQGDAIAYQILRLPMLKSAELGKAVRWELTKKGMAKAGHAILDYHVLRTNPSDKKCVVLAVSAEGPFLEDRIEEAQQAGLTVEQVDTTVQALERVFRKARLFRPDEDGAILEVGFGSSTLCFFRGADLQYARAFSLGGKDFLAAITGVVKADGASVTVIQQDAQLLLKTCGVPGDEMLKTSPARAFLSQISSRMRPVLEEMASELRRSLEFYVSNSGFGPVGTLYLSGGTGGMNNLDRYLAKELGLAVEILQPFEALKLNLPGPFTASPSSFTVPLGLAMAGGYRLKLMPAKYAWESLDRIATRRVKVFGTAAIAGALIFGAGLEIWQAVLHKRMTALGEQCAVLAGPMDTCKKILEIQKTIKEREQLIAGNALRQPLWEGVLKEISNNMPDNCVLTELSLIPQSVPKTIKLVGTIYADNQSADSQLGVFMEKMQVGPYWLSFDLASRTRIPDAQTPASTFEMHGVLEY